MLEKLPHALGAALAGFKAGLAKTAYHAAFAEVPESLAVTSEALADGAAIPARFTEDGPGTSPPLAWSGLPAGTQRVAVLVEDAGSPTPNPLVHLIAWNLTPEDFFGEGDLPSPGGAGTARALSKKELGKNSFLKSLWLPPDPPSGHGPHLYLFQVYALARPLDLAPEPGRGALIEAMQGHVLAKGCLAGTYARA